MSYLCRTFTQYMTVSLTMSMTRVLSTFIIILSVSGALAQDDDVPSCQPGDLFLPESIPQGLKGISIRLATLVLKISSYLTLLPDYKISEDKICTLK